MVVLVVLDGWGERKCKLGNAIKLAKTPTYDFLKKNFPFTLLSASEMAVGLAKNQEGNSEAGHLNLGAGKVVLQDLSIINNAIKDKSFQKNPALNAALDNVTKNNSSLHILALVSNGCVHSAMEHIKEIITCAKQKGIKNLFVHAFTDGRDTKQRSASKFLYELERHMSKAHLGQISSITGRIYAMDREERYERLKPAYEAIANAKADEDFSSWQQCIKSNYQKNISDEFFPAATIAGGKRIEAGDSVVFANFRNDRAKELTSAISQADFTHFKTRQISNLTFVTLTKYDQGFKNVQAMFDPQKDYDCLGEILSKNKKRQLRLAETTKYAHVTYFFNAGKKEPFENEDRILVETKKTKEFDKFPEMRAKEITAKLVGNIKSKKYDFILTNLSNADMVGHTANLGATILAVECIDICLKKIYKACCDASADLLICADHGNADKLLDFRKKKLTSHSKSKVPCILISNNFRNIKLAKNKKLANVAPTVLKLLNIPNAFEEEPLF